MEQQFPEQKKTNTGLKIIVLVILIALLVVGILLPIKIIPGAVSSIANTLSSIFLPREKIKLTLDKSMIDSGDVATLTWSGAHKVNGSYSLSYTCKDGVRLETSVNQPNETIPCNSPYFFTPSTNTINFKAYSTTNRFTDTNLTLGFLEKNASTADTLGNVTLTIQNSKLSSVIGNSTSTATTTSTSTTVKPQPKPSTSAPAPIRQYQVSNPNSLANLEVRLIALGHLTSTGVFVPSPVVSSSDQAAIKFSIVNVGDKNTGSWTFSASLPSLTDPYYNSAPQINLGPGDRVEYTLGFLNINTASNGIATITADPSNIIPERSKANNTLQVRFTIQNGTPITGSGQPDLTLRILATGVINRSTNQFTQTNTVNAGDRVGVRFEVQNIGQTATGAWQFKATLPTTDSNSSTFTSANQTSLNPGQTSTYIVGFDNIQFQGSNTATVTVDSGNSVSESNENNNTATVTIIRN